MSEDKLHIMRHSLAHITAAAVQRIWPDAKFGVGPVVDNGFYYDIDLGDKKISEANFAKIEKAMKGIDLGQDVYLKPFDIVLVPRTRIADINLWVNQYIRGTVSMPREFLYYYQFEQSLGTSSNSLY